MIETVIKLDGTQEPFSEAKLNNWIRKAVGENSKNIGWSTIAFEVVKGMPEVVTSKELQLALINRLLAGESWTHYKLAGRLTAKLIRNEVFGADEYPSIRAVQQKLQKLGLMRDLGYTDEEMDELEGIIQHDLDLESPHFAHEQFRNKYSMRTVHTDTEYETQQFVYMRMAMCVFEKLPATDALRVKSAIFESLEDNDPAKRSRLEHVIRLYRLMANKILSSPTPNYNNLGSFHRGYASCCLYQAIDDRFSISAANHIADMMTTQSAGLGENLNLRSIGEPVQGGRFLHRGLKPYIDVAGKLARANIQGGRGGALNIQVNIFHQEAEMVVRLRDTRADVKKGNRDAQYGYLANGYFYSKAAKNESVFHWNVHTAPTLDELYYSDDIHGFIAEYERLEKDPTFEKVYFNARELLMQALQQGVGTGTIHGLDIGEMNRNTPYIDPIHSSNLCVAPETLLLTRQGHQRIDELVGQKVDIWNGNRWSNVEVVKTSDNSELVTVTLTNGMSLACTEYHKWYMQEESGRVFEVRTRELEDHDEKLIVLETQVIEGDQSYDKTTGKVPTALHKVADRIEWVKNYFGMFHHMHQGDEICAQSWNPEYILEVQRMLQTLGVQSTVKYNEKLATIWLRGSQTRKLMALGLQMDSIDLENGSNNPADPVLVKSIIRTARMDATYCVTEPIRHMAVFNGILTGQCVEIKEPTEAYSGPDAMKDLYSDKEVGYIVLEGISTHGTMNLKYRFSAATVLRLVNHRKHKVTAQHLKEGMVFKHYGEEVEVLRILELKKEPEVALCSLAAINLTETLTEYQYKEATYYALRVIDYCILENEYILPHMGVTAKKRMNAGVGLMGVATHMARKRLRYDTKEGLEEGHRIAERHYWHLVNASLQISNERGLAPWIDRTKYPEGWLPQDNVKPFVNTLADFKCEYDWKSKQQEIIDNGGLAHSVLCAYMPGESSSKALAATNSIYGIRRAVLLKTDAENVMRWAAPYSDDPAYMYQSFWDISIKAQNSWYAVFQKFCDQMISADWFEDFNKRSMIPATELLDNEFDRIKKGVASRYYFNILMPTKGESLNAKKENLVQAATGQAPAEKTLSPSELLAIQLMGGSVQEQDVCEGCGV